MEHAIKAPADGSVSEVFFAEGDLVSEGAELIALETRLRGGRLMAFPANRSASSRWHHGTALQNEPGTGDRHRGQG